MSESKRGMRHQENVPKNAVERLHVRFREEMERQGNAWEQSLTDDDKRIWVVEQILRELGSDAKAELLGLIANGGSAKFSGDILPYLAARDSHKERYDQLQQEKMKWDREMRERVGAIKKK